MAQPKRIPLDLPPAVHARLTAVAELAAKDPFLDPSVAKIAPLFRSLLVAHFGPSILTEGPSESRTAQDLEHVKLLRTATYLNPMGVAPNISGALSASLDGAVPKPKPAPAPSPVSSHAPVSPFEPPKQPEPRKRREDPHDTVLRDLVGVLAGMDMSIFPENLKKGYKLLETPTIPPLEEVTFKLDATTQKTVIRYSHLCQLLGMVPNTTDEFGTSTSPSTLNAFRGSDGEWWVGADAEDLRFVYENLAPNLGAVQNYIHSAWMDILEVLKGDPCLTLEFAR